MKKITIEQFEKMIENETPKKKGYGQIREICNTFLGERGSGFIIDVKEWKGFGYRAQGPVASIEAYIGELNKKRDIGTEKIIIKKHHIKSKNQWAIVRVQ